MRNTEQNIQHAASPKPGDYWDEMFAPVALILDAGPHHVAYLEHKVSAGNGWTWDTSRVTVKKPAEFREWISYSTRPGTWADVTPGWKHWREFAEEAQTAAGSADGAGVETSDGGLPG